MKAFIMLALSVSSIFAQKVMLPVAIKQGASSFNGSLTVVVAGSREQARLEWSGPISNTSPGKIFRATFCVKAFMADGSPLRSSEDECVLRVWGTNWGPGVSLNFKGKRTVRLGDGKAELKGLRYEISPIEVFDAPPSTRTMAANCDEVWAVSLRILADRKFRPTMLSKESLVATFSYDGGIVNGFDSRPVLQQYTLASFGTWGPYWQGFRIEPMSLYLRPDRGGHCSAEFKMGFSGFAGGWIETPSNFTYEKDLLDAIAKALPSK